MPVHVHPENDIVEHELTEKCVCGPSVVTQQVVEGVIEEYENGPIVIHHSMDGREAGEKQLITDNHAAKETARVKLRVRGKWLCTEVKPC